MNMSIGLAFLAGLASFLSPCVLPLVPAYIGYLSGRSFSANSYEQPNDKWNTFFHGLAFVLGFSLVFISIGVLISTFGSFFRDARDWISRIGGLIVILFGLHLSGLVHIPFLDYELKPVTLTQRNRGFFSSLFMGILFSAGWSPCVGPVLGAIYTLTWIQGNIFDGVLLLSIYSLGLGIPFLLTGLGIGWVTQWLKKYQKGMMILQKLMGIILILVGILLLLGLLEQMGRFGIGLNLGI